LGCVAKCPECSKDLVEIPIRYGLPLNAGECERRGEALEGGCVLFLDMNVAEACLECRKYRIPAVGTEAKQWYRLPLHFGVEKVVGD